jgi:hypothetical protein
MVIYIRSRKATTRSNPSPTAHMAHTCCVEVSNEPLTYIIHIHIYIYIYIGAAKRTGHIDQMQTWTGVSVAARSDENLASDVG